MGPQAKLTKTKAPPDKGRGRRGRNVPDAAPVVELDLEEEPPRRGRGRPPKPKTKPSELRVTCISFPVTDQDEEEVECRLCHMNTTFREFRIHNMQEHANIATVTTDPTVPDHKFYERKLKELSKFTRVKIFRCPVANCGTSYKSALGLAFHLETCGKSKEEIELCLIQCDVCGRKFTFPNFKWHEKSHKKENSPSVNSDTRPLSLSKPNKRQSAIRAREIFQQETDTNEDDLGKPKKRIRKDDDYHDPEFSSDFGSNFVEVETFNKSTKQRWHQAESLLKQKLVITNGKCDFSPNATQFINSEKNATTNAFWNSPNRITVDPFSSISDNSWKEPDSVIEYLPKKRESVAFKTEVQTIVPSDLFEHSITKGYAKLPWFEGQMVDDNDGNLIFNAGGPIFGLSWHPCGWFLAISTGSDPFEDLDYKIQTQRKSSIHIYSHFYKRRTEKFPPFNILVPKLIICADYGYATHVKWANFWPQCWDDYIQDEASFNKTNPRTRIGFLACSFEDASIRIYSIKVEDVMMRPNFCHDKKNKKSKIPVYGKTPEICLKIDASVFPNTGQICKFDWHDENRFIIAGYCSGLIAIFDLKTTSPLLKDTDEDNGTVVQVLSPFWVFQGHIGPVTGVHFDPASPRYFVTASKDRFIKLWDLHLRKEVESKKIGLVLDTCWIRGWIHIAVAVDASISNLSSQYNFVRFYQIGTTQGRPNCSEFMDISSLSFHNGITVQATENGNITATYFDNFWRDSDYDRNKKKHNVVNICKVGLDTKSFASITKKDFPKLNANYKPFTFGEDEPRIVFTFYKERLKAQVMRDPEQQYFEDYIRFFPFLRINMVRWCPRGECFAVGYRSGLLTIVPASFDTLYAT